jgi:hypothetical protein
MSIQDGDMSSLWKGSLAILVGGALGFFTQYYFTSSHDTHEHDQSIETRIHQQDLDIDALKITTTAMGVEVKGVESSIAQILASQNANAATLQVLKDSDDARKEQMNEIKLQLSAINDVLRPTRTFPHN